MSATVRLPLFIQPPRVASGSLLGGLTKLYSRNAPLSLSSVDWGVGFNSVYEIKVWGDIADGFRPEWAASTEVDAKWRPYEPVVPVVLTTGEGDKTINAKVRTVHGIESETVSTTFEVELPEPHISILWDYFDPRGTIALSVTHSHQIDTIRVCLVPSVHALVDDEGVTTITERNLIGDPSSRNLAGGVNDFTEDELDLSVDPYPTQQGQKFIKVFAKRTSDGTWFSGMGQSG